MIFIINYKNYPNSKKATLLSFFLGLLTNFIFLMLFAAFLTYFVEEAFSIGEEAYVILYIILSIAIIFPVKKFLKPFLQKKIDQIAYADSGFNPNANNISNHPQNNNTPTYPPNNNIPNFPNNNQINNVPTNITIPDFPSNNQQSTFTLDPYTNNATSKKNPNMDIYEGPEVKFDKNPMYFDK